MRGARRTVNKMKDEDIDYITYDKEEVSEEQIESFVELLHRYLNEFISKAPLRRDVVYCFEEGRAVAAYHRDELVGAVVGVHTPFFDKFHIAHIAVEEGYRDLGIGKELTRKMVPKGAQASVHLNVDNPDIVDFYKNLGFTVTHERLISGLSDDSSKKPSD